MFLVDSPAPGVPTEFAELQPAIDDVCLRLEPGQNGVVEIRRSQPVLLDGKLNLSCRVRIEVGQGFKTGLASTHPLVITSRGGVSLSGMVITAPSVSLESDGPVELQSNEISAPTVVHLSGTGGARVVGNSLSQLELRVDEVAASAYAIVANQPLAGAGRSSGEASIRLTGLTPEADVAFNENRGFGNLEVDTRLRGAMDLDMNSNLSSRMKVKLCGNEVASVDAHANTSDGIRLSFGLPRLDLASLGSRHGRVAIDLIRCAGFAASESKVVAALEDLVAQERLSFDSPAGLPVDVELGLKELRSGDLAVQIRNVGDLPCLDLKARQSVMTGDFIYDVKCSAKTDLGGVEIGGNLEATLAGNVQEMLMAQVTGEGSLYVNAADAKGEVAFDGTDLRAKGDISFRRLIGVPAKVGINGAVSIATGAMQAGLILEADSADRNREREGEGFLSFVHRVLLSGAPKSSREENLMDIRNVELRGVAALLSIGDFDGSVTIGNARVISSSDSMMRPGGVWIRDVAGAVTLNDVTAVASCPISCHPLIVNGAEKLSVSGGRLENIRGSVLDGDVSDVELRGVEMVGVHSEDGQFKTLTLGAGAEHRRVSIQGGSLTGDLLAIGDVVIQMSGVRFSGDAVVHDGGSSLNGHPGAFPQDPTASNSGLSADRLHSSTDWDGNGCRDYPVESNVIDENGYCIEEGYSPPNYR
ncbi:MAG: hypothetical protein IT285_15760 [Bdellovibrionales bacterium]|nr:hypothetical protein [Bdellovibrionales bacterium]